MGHSILGRARPFSLLAALLLVILSLGSGGSASADPGHGPKGRPQVSAATGHSKHQPQGAHTLAVAKPTGDLDAAQPPSQADRNAGGANGACPQGPYCSTRDGRPSANGNDGGQATGKPCMGCVGKADNKNPPGQEKQDPAGTFPNNGYECDNNNGIGKTNPAHTGCGSAPSPSPSTSPY
jgi:hypothetical protein